MADAGIEDILIVYPLWGDKKWARLVDLSSRVRVTVAVDSLEVAAGISRAAKAAGTEIGIRAEFDTGFHRCGWPIAVSSMLEIQKLVALPGLRWDGILVYPGHIMGNQTIREQDIERENESMDELLELLDSASISYPVVSGGNTPAAFSSHRFHGLTEIRPGTYVFNDRNTVDAESAQFADCALTVLVTVVSKSVSHRAIVDSGSKTLSADQLLSGDRRGYGYVLGYPDVKLEDLSEEHGHLSIPTGSQIHIGDRLRVIPNHVYTCINLHDRIFVVEGEHVVFALTFLGVYDKDARVFDPNSAIGQHFAPVKWYLAVHGSFGAMAMLVAAFQFSNRLRARYLGMHRVLGYLYVTSVFIACPFAVLISRKLALSPSQFVANCVTTAFAPATSSSTGGG